MTNNGTSLYPTYYLLLTHTYSSILIAKEWMATNQHTINLPTKCEKYFCTVRVLIASKSQMRTSSKWLATLPMFRSLLTHTPVCMCVFVHVFMAVFRLMNNAYQMRRWKCHVVEVCCSWNNFIKSFGRKNNCFSLLFPLNNGIIAFNLSWSSW